MPRARKTNRQIPLSGERVPHRRTTATPQHSGELSLQGVTGVSSFFWRAASRIARLSSRVASGTSDRSSIRSETSATRRIGGEVHAERQSRPEKVRTIISPSGSPCAPFNVLAALIPFLFPGGVEAYASP